MLADLIARAKAAPGSLNYSSPGAGTKSHLTGEQLKLRAGVEMVHIPYRGGGPATMAVLDGTVHVGSVALAPVEPLVKEGKFRALAVTGPERWFSLPDVPTMIELGFPGFVSDTFNALFAPAGTPLAIVALLSKESRAALETPEARDQARRAGYQIVAGTPEQLGGAARRGNSRREGAGGQARYQAGIGAANNLSRLSGRRFCYSSVFHCMETKR